MVTRKKSESTGAVVLRCDMARDCDATVTHIDEKGYAYCAAHGVQRRESGRRCRKLRPWELAVLRTGKPLPSYDPRPKPAPSVDDLRTELAALRVSLTCEREAHDATRRLLADARALSTRA